MRIAAGKKIYFLSDFHLGAPDYAASRLRENRLVKFLDEIEADAAEIFILGDLFDFWYEYKKVVPKGFVRILGKLANLTDRGVKVHFFVGNHDMWMRDYFEKELGVSVYHDTAEFEFNEKQFFIGHGDGLGPGDHKYKFIKKVFRNKLSKTLFGFLHPHAGIGLANYFSRKSRRHAGLADEKFLGEDREWLILFSKKILQTKHVDFFVFGHRHLPLDYRLTEMSRYINLGDWVKYFSYAVFDGDDMQLKFYTT